MKRLLWTTAALAALTIAPANARQWWVLIRQNTADAYPNMCVTNAALPVAWPNPAAFYNYAAREGKDPSIIDDGGDMVTVRFTDADHPNLPAYYFFFRTSEACEKAAQAVRANDASRDQYR
jgi:hypothetical protein